ncbi:MAG: DNA alkylation repair protein [Elusimicrobia bacterium]|nr:DNA alkylation repair protein [Elusimicrobiota bacterium]
MPLAQIERGLSALANPARAKANRWFFKTGPGEYGEGDEFIGITVPQIRALAKAHKALPLPDVQKLLNSPIHEKRLLALIILVLQFSKATERTRARIYRFYVKNFPRINNWDLVDSSAPNIVGAYLAGKDKRPLYEWIRSADMWRRRIAMLATLHDIRLDNYTHALRLAEELLKDKEDLLHKAAGWMLREVDKRHRPAAVAFLNKHSKQMPRTMLRYALERFPESERQRYLKK